MAGPHMNKWDIMSLVSAGLTFCGFIFETISSLHIRNDVDSRIEQVLDERGYKDLNNSTKTKEK